MLSMLIIPTLLIFSGCGLTGSTLSTSNSPSNTPPTPSTPNVQVNTTKASSYNINIEKFTFSPATLTISKGSTVTWINNDSAPHQIKSAIFKSASFSKGQSVSYTFNTAGTFDYICPIHPSMTGQIIVE